MNFLKNLSIKNKLSAIIMVVTTLATGLGFLFIFIYELADIEEQLISNTELAAMITAENTAAPLAFGNRDGVKDVLRKLQDLSYITGVAVYQLNGDLFASYKYKKDELPKSYPMPEETEIIDKENAILLVKPIILDDISYGTIVLRVSTEVLYEKRLDFVFTLVLFMIAIIFFSYIFAFILQHLISRPILQLAKVTQDISKGGDYSVRVKKESEDELGKLYEGFNNMLEQIEQRDKDVSESEQRYRALVEFAPVPIYVQTDGIFEYVNPAAVKLFEASRKQDLLGREVAPFFMKWSIKPYTAMLSRQESISLLLLQITTVKNAVLDVEAAALQLIFNKRSSNLIILLDVSKRKKAEDERRRLNKELISKNQELEQVVYVTSHDLRSPLVNIHGFSKELKNSLDRLQHLLADVEISTDKENDLTYLLDEDIPVSLDFIGKSCTKMDALLSGLLRLSRLGRTALSKENLNMEQMLREIHANFKYRLKEKNATFVMEDIPDCYGDAVQINQVFSNLIDNALKFLKPDIPGRIVISGKRSGRESTYVIEDNGIGIKTEHQKKVFEIFHRLNPVNSGGEGLGLSIISKIIERHSGKVWLESEPGKGTKFFVVIPDSQS